MSFSDWVTETIYFKVVSNSSNGTGTYRVAVTTERIKPD